MRMILASLLATTVAVPALASSPSSPQPNAVVAHNGETLRDANNVRLGPVNSIEKDGSVGIIYKSRYVVIPAASLSQAGGKLTTSLTKSQVDAL